MAESSEDQARTRHSAGLHRGVSVIIGYPKGDTPGCQKRAGNRVVEVVIGPLEGSHLCESGRLIPHTSMKPLCLAVVGFGREGKVCADSLLDSKDLVLGAVVRRLDSLAQSLPEAFCKIPVVSYVAQVQTVEGTLLCVQILDAAHECLQHKISIVESSVLHGEAFQAHRDEIHRLAVRHKIPPSSVPGGIPERCPSFGPSSRSWLRRATPRLRIASA